MRTGTGCKDAEYCADGRGNMNILFVCKHNRFRSKVAEALWRAFVRDKRFVVKSAGIARDVARAYVAANVHRAVEKRGGVIADEQPRVVSKQTIRWADYIVVVADNVDVKMFPHDKTEQWEVEDADESELEKIRVSTRKIEQHVRDLASRLGALARE